MFEKLDSDGSGGIDIEEFVDFVQGRMAKPNRILSSDSDSSPRARENGQVFDREVRQDDVNNAGEAKPNPPQW